MRHKNETFYFERGAYFAGTLWYRIEICEGKYIFRGRACNDFFWMKDYEFEVPKEELENIKKALAPVMKWERKYENENDILDGYGWSIYFKDKDILISTGGYEKYPTNYKRVIRDIQLFIERLIEKYNENYQLEGKKER